MLAMGDDGRAGGSSETGVSRAVMAGPPEPYLCAMASAKEDISFVGAASRFASETALKKSMEEQNRKGHNLNIKKGMTKRDVTTCHLIYLHRIICKLINLN